MYCHIEVNLSSCRKKQLSHINVDNFLNFITNYEFSTMTIYQKTSNIYCMQNHAVYFAYQTSSNFNSMVDFYND